MLLRIALALACSILALGYARRRRFLAAFFPTSRCPHESPPTLLQEEIIEAGVQESCSPDLKPEFEDTVEGGIGPSIDSDYDGQMSRKNFSPTTHRDNSKTKLSNSEEHACNSEYEIAKPRLKSEDSSDAITSLDETEISRLKIVVTDMRKEERKLEVRILECKRLKARQESNLEELKRQLAEKDAQIQSLGLHFIALEAHIDKTFQDLSENAISEDLQVAKIEIRELQKRIRDDASHTKKRLLLLKQQLGKLQEIEERNSEKELQLEESLQISKELEIEVPELHQRNQELERENQELTMTVEAAERRAAEISAVTERYLFAKAEAEASELRHANDHLSKLAESLQINRFIDVDELVYLRWVNACLRHELDTYKASSENSTRESSCSPPSLQPNHSPFNNLVAPKANTESVNVSKPLYSQITELSQPKEPKKNFTKDPDDSIRNPKPKIRRHSTSSLSILDAYLQRNGDAAVSYSNNGTNKYFNRRFSYTASSGNRRDLARARSLAYSRGGTGSPRQYQPTRVESIAENTDDSEKVAASFQLLSAASSLKNKRPLFKDLPKTSRMDQSTINEDSGVEILKDVPKTLRRDQTAVNEDTRIEALKRHPPKLGERKDQSMPLLAVKIDEEAQGNLVRDLAKEIQAADYSNIEDVVAFVNWLDVEVAYMIDEEAVLEHFRLPKNYIDALREATSEYQYLKKMEVDVGSYEDEPKMPCDIALEAILFLQEKVEDCVNAFLESRETAIATYKQFNIPTYWMLDSGLIGEIKLASVQLAQKFMKRVIAELDVVSKEKPLWYLLLGQAAKFAFRVHQFAGGFDMKTLCTFKDLQSKADDLPDCQPIIPESHSQANWKSKMYVDCV